MLRVPSCGAAPKPLVNLVHQSRWDKFMCPDLIAGRWTAGNSSLKHFGWADLAAAEVKGTVVSGYKTHSGNWFTDSAGTTALGALPGTNDKFYRNNTALNGKEIVIPNGTAASVYTLELGTEDDSVLK